MRVNATTTEQDQPEKNETPESAPSITTGSTLTLAQRMALPEPRRTAELEKATESGEQFYLRSRSGKTLKQRYGKHLLELSKAPKGFSAAHAIHLIWYLGDAVEEVIEE